MAPSQLPTAAAASPAPAVRQASSVQFTHSELQWPRHICPLPPLPARPPLSDRPPQYSSHTVSTVAPSQLPTAAAASPAPAVRQASSVQFTHSELQWPRHSCPLPPLPARPPL